MPASTKRITSKVEDATVPPPAKKRGRKPNVSSNKEKESGELDSYQETNDDTVESNDPNDSNDKSSRRLTMNEIVAEASGKSFHKRHANFANTQYQQHHDSNYDGNVFMAHEFPPLSSKSGTPSLPSSSSTSSSAFAIATAAAATVASVAANDPILHNIKIGPPPSTITSPSKKVNQLYSPRKSPSKSKSYQKYYNIDLSNIRTNIFDVDNNNNRPPSPSKQKSQTLQQQQQQYPNSFYELSEIAKTQILNRITGRTPIPLVGLDHEYSNVYSLLERTITEGEGNSCLIIGPRSTGKTLVCLIKSTVMFITHLFKLLTNILFTFFFFFFI